MPNKKIKNILFVGLNNTFCSIIAHGYFQYLLLKNKYENKFFPKSAGTMTIYGLLPSPIAIKILKKYKIDISKHKSLPVSKKLLEWADIALTMTAGEEIFLKREYPEYKEKIFTLIEYTRSERFKFSIFDIENPFNIQSDIKEVRKKFKEIEKAINLLFEKLIKK